MSVSKKGIFTEPNTHTASTLPTEGFIENKTVATGSNAYNPTTATNSCMSLPNIQLNVNHISGATNFQGHKYRVTFNFTWSGYTSGKAWLQGAVNGSWSSGTNWFTASGRGAKEISALTNGGASGKYNFDYDVVIQNTGTYQFGFGIRSDSANPGTYYKISDFKVYSYDGCIQSKSACFEHYYEW